MEAVRPQPRGRDVKIPWTADRVENSWQNGVIMETDFAQLNIDCAVISEFKVVPSKKLVLTLLRCPQKADSRIQSEHDLQFNFVKDFKIALRSEPWLRVISHAVFSESDNASLNTTFAHDATNKLTSRTLPNGVATSYQYDGLDRLTRLTHSKAGNTLADFQYQFNAVGNITQMTDGADVNNYNYDPLDRLTAATHPNQTNESYTFDDVGNRTASHQGSSYTYQAFSPLVFLIKG